MNRYGVKAERLQDKT